MLLISELACIEYCLQKVISVKIIYQCDIKVCVQLYETILFHHEIDHLLTSSHYLYIAGFEILFYLSINFRTKPSITIIPSIVNKRLLRKYDKY